MHCFKTHCYEILSSKPPGNQKLIVEKIILYKHGLNKIIIWPDIYTIRLLALSIADNAETNDF